LPLCPIPGRKGNSDVAGVASHGDGPFGQGRQVQHSDALDRLDRTQARHRRLAVKISKPFAGNILIENQADNDISRPTPLNSATWTNVSISATDAADIARKPVRLKVEIIKLNQTEVICDLLKSTFDKADRLGSAVNRIFAAGTEAQLWASDAESRKGVDLKLKEKGHDPDSVLARAYRRGARDIDAIDKRIALYELRRSAILKEIGLRSERKARKLDQASSEVIEGEFSEAAE
jgi:hypothetical protein